MASVKVGVFTELTYTIRRNAALTHPRSSESVKWLEGLQQVGKISPVVWEQFFLLK